MSNPPRRIVTGHDASGKSVVLSDAPSYDFGGWGTGASAQHVFYLSNSGDLDATAVGSAGAIGAGFGYTGSGGFPGVGGNCGATLAGGAFCALDVTFSPPMAMTYAGTVSVAYTNSYGAQTATRAGTPRRRLSQMCSAASTWAKSGSASACVAGCSRSAASTRRFAHAE